MMSEQRGSWRTSRAATWLLVPVMALSLLWFYQLAGQFTVLASALWLAGFVLAGLLRPDLALLFVIATAPLAFRARGFWDAGVGVENIYIPLHELALLVTLAGTALHIGGRWLRRLIGPARDWRWPQRQAVLHHLKSDLWLPGLWLLAGTAAALMADGVGQRAAWREWRWVIVEPLALYGLVRWWGRDPLVRLRLCGALVLAGVAVALVGLLQQTIVDTALERSVAAWLGRAHIDFAPVEGVASCFGDILVETGGEVRVSSVYCHANNMALWLDRVWPLALVLAAAYLSGWPRIPGTPGGAAAGRRWLGGLRAGGWLGAALFAAGAVIGVIGVRATFSKGAWLAGLAVLLALVLISRRWPLILGGAVAAALVLMPMLNGSERLDPLGDSSHLRLSVWRSALAMGRDHPLGIGLDQFLYYFSPEYGRGYIEPMAIGEGTTSHPHNLILDFWLRVGPLGLLIFAGLMARTARRAWRIWRSPLRDRWLALGAAAALATGLLHGLVDQAYFAGDLAIVTWLLIGLIDTIWHGGAAPPEPAPAPPASAA